MRDNLRNYNDAMAERGRRNRDALHAATNGMTPEQRAMFNAYVLGSLSLHFTEDGWDAALSIAARCAEGSILNSPQPIK